MLTTKSRSLIKFLYEVVAFIVNGLVLVIQYLNIYIRIKGEVLCGLRKCPKGFSLLINTVIKHTGTEEWILDFESGLCSARVSVHCCL